MSDAARLELVRQRTGGPARLTEVLDRLPADMVLAHTGDGVLKPAGWWRAQVPAFKDATTYSLLVRGPGGLRRITVHGPEGALFEERVQGEDF